MTTEEFAAILLLKEKIIKIDKAIAQTERATSIAFQVNYSKLFALSLTDNPEDLDVILLGASERIKEAFLKECKLKRKELQEGFDLFQGSVTGSKKPQQQSKTK